MSQDWKFDVVHTAPLNPDGTSTNPGSQIGVIQRTDFGDRNGMNIEQVFDSMFAAMGTSEEQIIAEEYARYRAAERKRKWEAVWNWTFGWIPWFLGRKGEKRD